MFSYLFSMLFQIYYVIWFSQLCYEKGKWDIIILFHKWEDQDSEFCLDHTTPKWQSLPSVPGPLSPIHI